MDVGVRSGSVDRHGIQRSESKDSMHLTENSSVSGVASGCVYIQRQLLGMESLDGRQASDFDGVG